MFSGQIIYESWTLSFYNVLFTVLPPLALGILDQYVSAGLLDKYPQLYGIGQQNKFFKFKNFAQWIANAMYHSLLLYLGAVVFWYHDLIQADGLIAGKWVWGTALYGAVLLTVLGKAALITNNWTKYHVLSIPGSFVIWVVFIVFYASVFPRFNISIEYDGLVPRLFPSAVFWVQLVVLPVLCLLRDVAWKYAKRMYRPEAYHHIQEIQKYNIQDYRPRYDTNLSFLINHFRAVTSKKLKLISFHLHNSMDQFQKAIRKVRQVQRMRKQRGYAFSQADESQTRVLQAYDTTQNRGRYGEMASSKGR